MPAVAKWADFPRDSAERGRTDATPVAQSEAIVLHRVHDPLGSSPGQRYTCTSHAQLLAPAQREGDCPGPRWLGDSMVESQRPDPLIEGVLSQLGHAANLGISPEEFLTRAIDGLLQVARAPAGVACLVNRERNKLEVVSIRRIGAAVARTLPHAFHL